MYAKFWLSDNDIIIKDVTDKIQQMAVNENFEIIANTAKGEEDGLGLWCLMPLSTIF